MAGEIPRNPMAGQQQRQPVPVKIKAAAIATLVVFALVAFALVAFAVQIAWNDGITAAVGGNSVDYSEAWAATIGLLIVRQVFVRG